jgi:RNA polymerase sigma factor (TIGR02999 family)
MAAAAGEMRRITALLEEAHDGRAEALDEVVAIVHPQLMRLAEDRLRGFSSGRGTPTLEPAALVSETYLKLIRQRARYDSRGHFLAIASKLMLRVLIDHERERHRLKRGGRMLRVSLSEAEGLAVDGEDVSVEAFASALHRLESLNQRAAEIVKARMLWGLTITEIAASFGLSERTVERDWQFAERWLERELAAERG